MIKKYWGVAFVAFPLASILSGCVLTRIPEQPQTNTASITALYASPKHEVMSFMRSAMDSLGLVVVTENTDGDSILARNTTPDFPASLYVRLRESTQGGTHVTATSEYIIRGSAFEHLPMELIFQVNREMGRFEWNTTHLRAQVSFPRNEGCGNVSSLERPGHEPEEFVQIGQMPKPVGGLRSIHKRIRYTKAAQEAGIEGRIYVQFVVDEEGTVSCAEVKSGLPMGLSENALEAIVEQKFEPGLHEGSRVKVRMWLPITYRLRR